MGYQLYHCISIKELSLAFHQELGLTFSLQFDEEGQQDVLAFQFEADQVSLVQELFGLAPTLNASTVHASQSDFLTCVKNVLGISLPLGYDIGEHPSTDELCFYFSNQS